MATAGESAALPDLVNRPTRVERAGEPNAQAAGPILLVGGTTFAAAYVVVGMAGFSLWGALLAIGGTALVLLGLRLVSLRSP